MADELQTFTGLADCADLKAALDAACTAYDITTPLRVAHFMAQMSEESGNFQRLEENLNYTHASRLLAVFPSHFDDLADASEYVGDPEGIANRVYADRMGNGDEDSGDGWRFRGRGFLQDTGRSQYALLTAGLGHDFISNPDDLATLEWAALAAGWTWQEKRCNGLADADNITAITRAINGGLNGLVEREDALRRAKAIWT